MKKVFLILTLTVLFFSTVRGQFIEDALRYAQPNGVVTPRVGGLNTAYHGFADDAGAILYNPAGLTLIGGTEYSFGLGFTRNNLETKFLDNKLDFGVNNAYINHFAIVMPIKQMERRAALAIGYFHDTDFENSYRFDGFNDDNTYIAWQAQNGPAERNLNWAKFMELAYDDGFSYYQDSLQQTGRVHEEGGIHDIVGSASFDLNEYLAFGISIIGKWGSYDYIREYSERDVKNIYNKIKVYDLTSLQIDDKVSQSVSGISGSIGFQGRFKKFARFGIAVQFPTWYEIEEDFGRYYYSYFDNGDALEDKVLGKNSYNLTTPFVYSGGVSVNALGLAFGAGVEYRDVTQLEFSDAVPEVERLNLDIVEDLVGQVTWGVGVEYDIPIMPLMVRASFSRVTSPYQDDIANSNKTFLSLGGSLILGKSIRIDGLFRWSDVSELRNLYGGSNGANYIYTISPLNISLGLTYRPGS